MSSRNRELEEHHWWYSVRCHVVSVVFAVEDLKYVFSVENAMLNC
jgi:hypothetical protein